MAAFFVLLATLIRLIQSQPVYFKIDSQFQGTDVICEANQDCLVDCIDCSNKIIVCSTGFSCTVNFVYGSFATIQATQVVKMEISCSSCRSLTIDATLSSQPESEFILTCTNDGTTNYLYPGCLSLNATIVHERSAYTSTPSNANIMNIYCSGTSACDGIYIDSTINGNLRAICNGDNTCNRGQIVHNPPANTGALMNVECLGTLEACYWLKIMSLTARTIHVKCGDGTQDILSRVCYLLQITGPVMPFDVMEYSMSTINADSVVVECNGDQCARVEIYVPFGSFQTTAIDYVYELGNELYILYDSCGWDFPSGGTLVCMYMNRRTNSPNPHRMGHSAT